ncbi:MAG: DUF1684 domain-containing protein [Chloroflexi bacterium]|nr:DUF1684 domain-containing protein [Chloroflexota bacterium]
MTDRAERLAGYRHRRDHFFAEHPHSPLNDSQRERFSGLDYFPERADLALTLPLLETGPGVGEVIDIPTTDGKVKPFVRVGFVTFDVDGVPVQLTVFKDGDRGGLFIPFRDASAGEETYEIGRYLEPQSRPDGTLDIDFNYSYNPFCAYGDEWSCPIPPEENRVGVAIRAGERAFRDAAATASGSSELSS